MKAVTSTRIFNTTPDKIYSMFSNPEILARWWGPNGFTNIFDVFEFKENGHWNFIMKSAEGKEYKNESIFKELVPSKKIVIDHVSPPKFTLTITLEEENGKTKMTWFQDFETEALYENVKSVVVPSNEQNFDRLEKLIGS